MNKQSKDKPPDGKKPKKKTSKLYEKANELLKGKNYLPEDTSLLKSMYTVASFRGKARISEELSACYLKDVLDELHKHQNELEKLVDERTAEVKEKEKKYRLLFEHSGSAITFFDCDGIFVLVNKEGLKNLAKKAKDVIGKSIYDIFSEQDAAYIMQRFSLIITEGKGAIFEDCVELPGGKRWFSSSNQPVIDIDGNITGIQVMSHDITDRKLAEEALQRSEKRFKGMIENSFDLVTILDGDGIIIYESPSMENILGYKKGDLLGTSVFDRIHPDDISKAMEVFSQTIQQPSVKMSIDCRFQHKNGSWRILETLGVNLLHDPAVEGLVLNSRDITDFMAAKNNPS
ncbi:PAS domain S-box protein [Planctomycetota bacterium]